MKLNKRLDNLVKKCVELSFERQGHLIESQVKNFTRLLTKLPYHQAIPSMSQYLSRLKEELSKKVLVIETSSPLSKAEIEEIFQLVSKKMAIYQVESRTDPSLLGGLRIKVGDMVYDDSIKEKINQIKGIIYG